MKRNTLPKATKIALLQSKFHRITKHRMNNLLQQFDLRTAEWIILGFLEHKAGYVPYADISTSLGIQESFLTVSINKLKNQSYLDTMVDDADKRKKSTRITAEGKKVLKHIDKLFLVDFAPFLKGLSAKDLEHFISIVKKVIQNSEKVK